ncbi:MAG: glycosyltransferase [Bacteroidales bacterium]|nr:glycosyltransferase [Bacteroidales bacterium]
MIRVLRIINRFNIGGPTYNAAYLTAYLPKKYKTLLIGGIHEDDEESSRYILEQLGIHAVVIPELVRDIKPYNDIMAYRKIVNIIKKFNPHIVHTHASKAGAIGRLAAIRMKVPVIVHTFHGHVFHSYFGKGKTKFFIKIERYLASKSDAIIALSKQQKFDLTEVYKIAPANKVKIIPLGFNLSKFTEPKDIKRISFRQKYNIKNSDIIISTIGRLVPVKNHYMFINAIAKAKQRTTKKIKAIIAGDGSEKGNLINYAKSLGLRVSLNGDVNDDFDIKFLSWVKEIDELYCSTDIVALTSLNEGTPVCLIEAQAAGVPIVATNVGGIKDIVLENKTALLCSPNNVDDFLEKLLLLINDDGLRYQLSVFSRSFIYNTFSYENLVKNMTNLYETLLSEKGIIFDKQKNFCQVK